MVNYTDSVDIGSEGGSLLEILTNDSIFCRNRASAMKEGRLLLRRGSNLPDHRYAGHNSAMPTGQ